MSDRIAVIDKGRFHQIGSAARYLRAARKAASSPSSSANRISCRSRSDGGSAHYSATVRCSWRSRHAIRPASNFLSLRPEKLKLVDAAAEDGLNVFEGTARELVYQGESTLLYVDLPDGRRGRDPPAGDKCRAQRCRPRARRYGSGSAGWRHDARARRARAMTATSLADEDSRRDHAAWKAPQRAPPTAGAERNETTVLGGAGRAGPPADRRHRAGPDRLAVLAFLPQRLTDFTLRALRAPAAPDLSPDAQDDVRAVVPRHRHLHRARLSARLSHLAGARRGSPRSSCCWCCSRFGPRCSCAAMPGSCCCSGAGVVNTWLQDMGVIEAPLRLVHNFTGTTIGMVHIMLPFMVLPLYATMRSINRDYMRAAANLGASPVRAFWQRLRAALAARPRRRHHHRLRALPRLLCDAGAARRRARDDVVDADRAQCHLPLGLGCGERAWRRAACA